MMKPTILFDLDGTLLDTAPDLAYALNSIRMANQQASLPFETIRPAASHGTKGLLKIGFNISDQDPRFETLKQQLLAAYSDNIANHTKLFSGVAELIHYLTDNNFTWGIVTNKPGWLTEPLLQQITFPHPPHCVVSGDTVARAKPYPDPLLYACNLLNCRPANCIYIGDAERDIQAGKAAGMTTLIAGYGYLSIDDKPEQWQADGFIRAPKEIIDWLTLYNATTNITKANEAL